MEDYLVKTRSELPFVRAKQIQVNHIHNGRSIEQMYNPSLKNKGRKTINDRIYYKTQLKLKKLLFRPSSDY